MTQKKLIRFIGDVHANRNPNNINDQHYLSLLDNVEYSLQVGDLCGVHYNFLNGVDSDYHKFIGGNHENYNIIDQCPNHLGAFGVWDVSGFARIFFVRGAFSINYKECAIGVDWWPQEELSQSQLNSALELYEKEKPKIIVSHECPLSIVSFVTNPKITERFGYTSPIVQTRTNIALEEMHKIHSPEIHIFGHYHQDFDAVVGDTRFVCLNELSTLDFELES